MENSEGGSVVFCFARDGIYPAGWKAVIGLEEELPMSLLVPEMRSLAAERFEVLRHVALGQPIGRRLLALQTGLSERVVRGHVEVLEKTGILHVAPVGIRLTARGESVMTPLSRFFMSRPSVAETERKLCDILHMKRVIVVPGDTDVDDAVKKRIGQEAALAMSRSVKDGQIIAVSGGTTMAAMAAALPSVDLDVTVVPARGGFGENIEYQANTIAAVTARHLGGSYRMLHIPDGFSPELIERVREETPELSEVEALIHRADILAIGVGEANRMAQRHQLPSVLKNRLLSEGAVGEAIGLYAAPDGRILYHMHNVGVALSELETIPTVIIAAGGGSKGAAISAMAGAGVRGTLVTDEGAAEEILRLSQESQGAGKN